MTCRTVLLVMASVSLGLTACATAPAPTVTPVDIGAALADPHRPVNEVSRDADRRPTPLIQFAGIRPGMTVVDLLPGVGGAGYFTRIFSGVVGPKGTVYAYFGTAYDERLRSRGIDPERQGALYADFANVVALHTPLEQFRTPVPVDLVWTSNNYHDIHNSNYSIDVARLNADIFAALKPGGYYIVIDHRALDGAGSKATEALHRMDEAIARKEVEAAGFKFVASSEALTRPDDDRAKRVFEQGEHDHTDQFVLKFQKPR